jgi:flagellar protein FlaJ
MFIAQFDIFISLVSGFFVGSISGFVILTFFHSYPMQAITSKKRSIEANLPFAMNHMAAIAASGVQPSVMFKLLTRAEEYGEISMSARRIMRNIEAFGMDVTSAIREVANRTPSSEFKQFLYGVVSTIETGGDLKRYLQNSAREALFEYRLKREKYLATLSTYADFYTAVLIAAPLFFISILSVMSMVSGQLLGISIPTVMRIGIYGLIPFLNIMFVLFIHFTQPAL